MAQDSAGAAVQFGAGNIGRGFTGQLFSQSGLEVVYVDVVPEIVEGLNRERSYTITIAADPEERIRIDNVRAVDGREVDKVAEEVARCAVACTAVGVNVLGTIARPLREGLRLRMASRPEEPLNIVVCENMRDAAGALKDLVLQGVEPELAQWAEARVGFAQAVVGRMVPVRTAEERSEDPLGIRVEAYCKLPVDADALAGDLPELVGFQPRSNFQAYIDQKLFAHNMGHAASAYFGALKGYTYIWECMEDEEVRSQTRQAMDETARALVKCYHLDAAEHAEHVEDLLLRFGNRKLLDTVARVGGDPLRKLSREDRLVGAALFCREQNVEPVWVVRAIAAGLRYRNDNDRSAVAVSEMISSKGLEEALEEIAGVSADSEVGVEVVKEYRALERTGSFTGGLD